MALKELGLESREEGQGICHFGLGVFFGLLPVLGLGDVVGEDVVEDPFPAGNQVEQLATRVVMELSNQLGATGLLDLGDHGFEKGEF